MASKKVFYRKLKTKVVQQDNYRVVEIDRPINCPEPDCLCLTGYAGRLCWGRLPRPRRHDDLCNTHNFCWDGEPTEINDEDACLLIAGLAAVRRDVAENGLYAPPRPGEGLDYDFKAKP